MSTKSTIKYGDDFHFYNECFDDKHVYLDLDSTSWEASSDGGITVSIPLPIWAIIRESAPVELPYAEMGYSDIRKHVEKEVDERIEKYTSAPDKKSKALIAFFGSLAYGGAGDSRESQITKGIKYFERKRDEQSEILKQINIYKENNS